VTSVDGIVFSEALAAEGEVVFVNAFELGLDGVAQKRAGSLYRSRPKRNWPKTKNRIWT
jgi:ATP-dependent DNA ligase